MLIAAPVVTYLSPTSVRVSWTGTSGLTSWVFVNGLLYDNPVTYSGTSRSIDILNVPDPFCVEIQESAVGESILPIAIPLVRRPNIHWSARAGAVAYIVYRTPSPGGQEAAILYQKADSSFVTDYWHQPVKDWRAVGGVWNFFRVEDQNSVGAPSSGSQNRVFVQGLPAPPVSLAVAGSANVFTLTIGT